MGISYNEFDPLDDGGFFRVFLLKADIRARFSLLLLLLFNPVFFYNHWTHTELWIFSFAVIGLVFFYNHQYLRAIFAFSLAAMQNLGILPYAMIVGLAFIGDLYNQERQQQGIVSLLRFIKDKLRPLLVAGVCYIPAFIPMMHTYIHFGTYNLVAKEVMESSFLFDKIWAYLFDWNLGIFPFEPLLLIAFLFISVHCFRYDKRFAALNIIGVGGMLFIVAHELQINSGMLGISRYTVWILPMMIFFVVMQWRYGWKSLVAVSVFEAIFSAFIIAAVCFGNASGHVLYTCWQFAPWTEKIMDFMPHFYNPTHGIFYSRVMNREAYYRKEPVAYYNRNGFVRKILCSEEAIKKFELKEYGLIDDNQELYDFHKLDRQSVDEGKYIYFNTTDSVRLIRLYTPGNLLSFKKKDFNIKGYHIQGIFKPENEFTWTDGHEVTFSNIYFRDSMDQLQGVIRLGGVFNNNQRVIILANDIEVFSGVIHNEQNEISFVYPEMRGKHILNLKIMLPDANSPANIMNSKDRRMLGLKLQSIVFNKA